MKYRKLRIAWSAVCGIVCLLLIVLWVRSYWTCDIFTRIDGEQITTVKSNRGALFLARITTRQTIGQKTRSTGWSYSNNEAMDPAATLWGNATYTVSTTVAYLAIVLVVAAVSSVPWIQWRFSLRTLLLTMTFEAILMGLLAALVRYSSS
jgi:hypothetical protein